MTKKLEKTLGIDEVISIHEDILSNSPGLPGLCESRPLASALGRIDNHIEYGDVEDIFEIAALYAIVIAQGHSFNDANKRTAMVSMINFLLLNQISLDVADDQIEQMMVDIAEKKVDRNYVTSWLKKNANTNSESSF